MIHFGEFPSPCGDYGSYLSSKLPTAKKFKHWFPSPCGDYGSYHYLVCLSWFPCKRSFRPLAGIMVLIYKGLAENRALQVLKFPSPCGDYGSYPLQHNLY